MDPSQTRVINFIDEVNKQQELDNSYFTIMNDPAVKLRRLDETKKDGVNACMNKILTKICHNATPEEINGRDISVPDLDKVTANYVANRTGGKDFEYYVKEAIRRNPKHTSVIKSVFETVEKIVNDTYRDKSLNPETITENDFKFTITPEIDDKLTSVIRDNNLDDLADVIKDNVRNDAVTEVEMARREKEERNSLEEELMNDDSITTEAALEEALNARGYGETTIYLPSLFEAVMINKFNQMSYNNDIYGYTYISPDYCITEGVVDKIKTAFKTRSEANAKAAITKNHLQYVATIEGMYNAVYAEYRNKVAPINVNQVVSMMSKILNEPAIDTVTYKGKIDLDEVQTSANEFKKSVNGLISGKKLIRYKAPKKSKTYTVKEAISELKAASSTVDNFFKSPSVKEYASKASMYASSKANKCDNPKNVEIVYKMSTEYYVADLSYYTKAIEFIVDVVEFAKGLIAKFSNSSVKESAFAEAVTEYTLLNISKALYLESFSILEVDELARKYAEL